MTTVRFTWFQGLPTLSSCRVKTKKSLIFFKAIIFPRSTKEDGIRISVFLKLISKQENRIDTSSQFHSVNQYCVAALGGYILILGESKLICFAEVKPQRPVLLRGHQTVWWEQNSKFAKEKKIFFNKSWILEGETTMSETLKKQ